MRSSRWTSGQRPRALGEQMTPNDSWTMGCQPKNPDNPVCPATLGPDFDFSASPCHRHGERPRAARRCRRSPASPSRSIRTRTAPSCGSTGSARAADSAVSGAAPCDQTKAYFGVSDLLSPNAWRHACREPRHRRDRVERAAAEAAVRSRPHVPRVARCAPSR